MSVSPITISERDFTEQIRDVAKTLGWRRYHTWMSHKSAAGFPDEVLVRGRRLIFAELKSERGKVTPIQMEWLEALARTSAEVYVWRPSMLDGIVECLRAHFRVASAQRNGGWWHV